MSEHGFTRPVAIAIEQSIDDRQMFLAGFGNTIRKPFDGAETRPPMQVIDYGSKETVTCRRCDNVVQLKIDGQML